MNPEDTHSSGKYKWLSGNPLIHGDFQRAQRTQRATKISPGFRDRIRGFSIPDLAGDFLGCALNHVDDW